MHEAWCSIIIQSLHTNSCGINYNLISMSTDGHAFLWKTPREKQHFLHHSNVQRHEYLPPRFNNFRKNNSTFCRNQEIEKERKSLLHQRRSPSCVFIPGSNDLIEEKESSSFLHLLSLQGYLPLHHGGTRFRKLDTTEVSLQALSS